MKALNSKQMAETKGGFLWALFGVALLVGAIVGYILTDQDGQIN